MDISHRKRAHSFQIVVQTSNRVTPRSFLTIVHHGEDSQITTNSWTRGSVAGSSLAVNGISLSRASGLNPEVDPVIATKKLKNVKSMDEPEGLPVWRWKMRWKPGFEFVRMGLSWSSVWRR